MAVGVLTLSSLLIDVHGVTANEPATHGDDCDYWYVLLIGDQRAGWAHMAMTSENGYFHTKTKTKFSVRRGAVTIDMTMESHFVETADGQPIETTSKRGIGAQQIVQTMHFTHDAIQLITEQGGQRQQQLIPKPDENWLPPAALDRYIEQQIAAGAETISVSSLDPAVGPQVMQMTMKIVGREEVEVFGKIVPAVVWDVKSSIYPGITSREYVDATGRKVKTNVQLMPGMELTMILADEQLAKSDLDPPQIMAATLIRSDRSIEQPRRTRSAVFELKILQTNEECTVTKINLPNGGYQSVTWKDSQTARIVVDLDKPVKSINDSPTESYLAATAMLNHEDPVIEQLLKRAMGSQKRKSTGSAKATHLCNFVQRHIQEKDLSVGFATAGEVARTRVGDCTEHAVLLAALLRAANIPSRTVSGLVYIDQFLNQHDVFGYHMWTQAWITDRSSSGRWVDLDAALPARDNFDAMHIALATSSMSDAALVNDMMAIAPTIGKLSIRVLEASGDGRGEE